MRSQREKEGEKLYLIFDHWQLIRGSFHSLQTENNSSRKEGVGEDGEFSFANVESEVPQTFKQNYLAVS